MVWAASYLPFGGIDLVWVDTGVLTQNLRFPGQWFQAETGLHQNWHRDYDPTTGRYLQADPLGLVDGPSVYGYARQNALRCTDPRGEFIPLIIVGALIGGGFEWLDQINKYGRMCSLWRILLHGSIGAVGGGFGAAGGAALAGASLGAKLAYGSYTAAKFALVSAGVRNVVNHERGAQAVRSMAVSVISAGGGVVVGGTATGLGDVIGRSAPRSIVDDLFGELIGTTSGAGIEHALTPDNDRPKGCPCGSGG